LNVSQGEDDAVANLICVKVRREFRSEIEASREALWNISLRFVLQKRSARSDSGKGSRARFHAVKKRRRLGPLIKARREAAGLSQKELGRSVGVTASHVGYIESGARRPSHTLLFRLALTLAIDRKELCLVAYPELAPVILPLPSAEKGGAVWRRFAAVAAQHSVTPAELAVLQKISRLGKISSPNSYFWILNSIRQSFEAD
jgi:transcriptional regulator with XRE-family HTH domain